MRHVLLAACLLLAAVAVFAADAPPDPWLRASLLADRAALPRGGDFRAAVVLDMDAGYHVNANPPSLDFQIPTVVAPAPAPGITWGRVTYPAGEPFTAEWAEGKPVRVYGGRTVIFIEGRTATDAPPGPAALSVALSYQGCDAATCYQPATRTLRATVEIAETGAAAEAAHADVFSPPGAPSATRPGEPAAPAVRFEGETDVAAWYEQGLAAFLGLLFLGGLALNLTPCVFPLIPITMNVFAQQGEKRALRVLPLAAVYVLGLAATFTVVGVLAALAGRSLGVVLQSPWGVLGVVTVLAVMMASAMGAFDIHLPSGAMGRLGARKGVVGAAFMGMVMGAIAAPCVGPFLIALIAFVAARRSVPLGAAAFFAVGLGLGLPYLVLGTFTGLINRVPRSGGWLVWTKRLLALALGGMILYFLEPFIVPRMLWPMALAFIIFAAIYVGLLEGLSRRPFSRAFRTVRLAAAAAVLIGGIMFFAAYAPRGPVTEDAPAAEDGGAHVAWAAWSPGALDAARRADRPVLLYFGADWCAECRVWKARVFSDAEVVRASEDADRLYVDVTEPPTGEKLEFSERWRGTNPPAVIVIGRGGEVLKAWRDPPDAATVAETLRQAAAARTSE